MRFFTAGRPLLVLAALMTVGCVRSEKESAVIVLDRYWGPVIESGGALPEILKIVERTSGLAIEKFAVEKDKNPVDAVEAFLRGRKTKAVFFGALLAMDFQSLAERNPEISFIVLDAPSSPPEKTPFRWVRFGKEAGFEALGSEVRKRLESMKDGDGPRKPVLALVDVNHLRAYENHFEPAAFSDPKLEAIKIETSAKDPQESLKAKVTAELKKLPPFCILLAGEKSSFIFGLIRAESLLPIVLFDRGALPESKEHPLLFSLEKDYAAAMLAGLSCEEGKIVDVPMKVRKGEADNRNDGT